MHHSDFFRIEIISFPRAYKGDRLLIFEQEEQMSEQQKSERVNGSSENSETLRRAQGDKGRIRGFEGSSGKESATQTPHFANTVLLEREILLLRRLLSVLSLHPYMKKSHNQHFLYHL